MADSDEKKAIPCKVQNQEISRKIEKLQCNICAANYMNQNLKNDVKFKRKQKLIDAKESSVLDVIKDVQEFIIKNNDNKINQIDEGLDCNEYEYDYIKIEEEKNKPQEEAINNEDENEQNNKKENEEEIKNENVDIKESEIKKEEEPVKEKTKLEIEKENEFKLLEKKSEVLRRYLAENVLPLLSLGILHVANERPEDPVEALADYLLAKTFELKKVFQIE